MSRLLVLFLLLPPLIPAAALPHRWVYVVRNLWTDRDLDEIREIVRIASAHGLNGLVLSGGLDRLEQQPADYLERVRQVKAIWAQFHLELIPQIFSAGYGANVLSFDKNLAEGIGVTAAPYVVRNGEARIEPDPASNWSTRTWKTTRKTVCAVTNYRSSRAACPSWIPPPHTTVRRRSAWRTSPPNPYGLGRLRQEIAVHPHRLYRFTCWLKTEALAPANRFVIQVLDRGGRSLAPVSFDVPVTAGWQKLQIGFNSLDAPLVRIYAGIWGGRSGNFWLDDWSVEEIDLTNVRRRDGTPVTVRDAAAGSAYEEGHDYARIQDPSLNFRFDHEGPPIRALPGSRIRDGQSLLVDYYHGMSVNRGQVTICMSDPRLYQIWRERARRLHDLLAPDTYFLSMDEIRTGGSDLSCKQRHMTMGEILGDCFTQQFRMLRTLNPKAEVWTWSDMLEANHNATCNYYLVDGYYTGSWEHIPREMRIMCWYFEKRRQSLDFFQSWVL